MFILTILYGGVYMNLNYADRTVDLKASEIRELLKLTEKPEIISFAGGLPAPELFPVENIAIATSKVLAEKGRIALQYASTDGYLPLREIIVNERVKPSGIDCTVNNIMITNGSQQALEFSAKLFINEGDIIALESPSYLGAINAFLPYRPNFLEIPMDENGMIVEKLEEAIESGVEVKMIYVIPDFQNPSGITMSVERRKRLTQLAATHNIPIIEDNPYGDLRFNGEKLPPLKSFDNTNNVITLGTFSKTFCPGLRLGWIVASEDIVHKYILIKQGADLQCNTLSELIATEYMSDYCLDDHINEIIEVYRNRRNVMISSMEKYFPKDVKFTRPDGGLFTWVEVREDIDTRILAEEALKENVAFVPGASFFAVSKKNNCMRLNYSNMDEDNIVEGIKRLGKVLYKYY